MQTLIRFSCAAILFAASLYAQGGGNAAMSGTVSGPTGAVIVGAKVTMTQLGTEVKRSAATNDSGQFPIPALPPATYRLTVEAIGFKMYSREVTLLADQNGSLQIPMQLGTSAETVN